jgi:hypothetical protein
MLYTAKLHLNGEREAHRLFSYGRHLIREKKLPFFQHTVVEEEEEEANKKCFYAKL